MSMTPDELKIQQENKISGLINTNSNNLKAVTFYDRNMNIDIKCEHFKQLINKLRLQRVHKPFIVLDMLKLIEEDRSPVEIFNCLFIKIRNMKKRKCLDKIIKFVEHKNELVEMWAYLANRLQEKNKRNIIKEIKNRLEKEKKENTKNKETKKSVTFICSLLFNIFKEQHRHAFKNIEKYSQHILQQNVERMKKNISKEDLNIGPSQTFVRLKNNKTESSLKNLELEQYTSVFHQYTPSKKIEDTDISDKLEKERKIIIEEQKKLMIKILKCLMILTIKSKK